VVVDGAGGEVGAVVEPVAPPLPLLIIATAAAMTMIITTIAATT